MLPLITRNFLQTHTENEQFPIRCTSASINFTFRLFFSIHFLHHAEGKAKRFTVFGEAHNASEYMLVEVPLVKCGSVELPFPEWSRIYTRRKRLEMRFCTRGHLTSVCNMGEYASRNANSHSFVDLQSGARLYEIKGTIMLLESACPSFELRMARVYSCMVPKLEQWTGNVWTVNGFWNTYAVGVLVLSHCKISFVILCFIMCLNVVNGGTHRWKFNFDLMSNASRERWGDKQMG